jgi:hypothetical protein
MKKVKYGVAWGVSFWSCFWGRGRKDWAFGAADTLGRSHGQENGATIYFL